MKFSIRLILATTALALAGCSPEPGTPVPTDAPPTSTTASKPSKTDDNEAPKVKDPIDAAKFIEAPCSLLDAAVAAKFGLEGEGTERKGLSAPYCQWSAKERANYSIGFEPGNKKGLSDNYRAEQEGKWKYFDPTTVSDYPAAFLGQVDDRSKGYCGIVVGVRDELTFNVTVRGGSGPQACDEVKEIAGEVIATMKAGA